MRIQLCILLLVLGACQETARVDKSASAEGSAAADGVATDAAASSDAIPAEGGTSLPTSSTGQAIGLPGEQSKPQSGILTAGSYSDALNIDAFLRYLESNQYAPLFPVNSVLKPDMTRADWLALVPAPINTPFQKLDIALVIDVTGSMGDELRYLQTEWIDIINDLKTQHTDVGIRLSLVAYRDQGDSFVTASYAFTEDSTAFQSELAKYVVGGGGDYPEAADQALLLAQDLTWSDATSSKLLFWVADAPPHAENTDKAYNAILGLREKGVTIYPVAASGVGDEAERIMRIAALITGGSYLFLTDDSGVGNPHAKPHIPCYFVERLNQLLRRLIEERISGQKITPTPESIIRQVGTQQDGVCQP